MILVILQIVGRFVLWCSLPLAVVVNYQISGQPHQPVLQVALLRIVLFKGSIDPDKDFLGQVFRGVSAGCEPVGKIVDATSKSLDNLLPCRTVACAAPPY